MSEWIKVTDRLPRVSNGTLNRIEESDAWEYDYVLVASPFANGYCWGTARWTSRYGWQLMDNSNSRMEAPYAGDTWGTLDVSLITHWMPIDEPEDD